MTNQTNSVLKFFAAKIYCMYDGKEFPSVDFIQAESLADAIAIANQNAADGEYSFDEIDDVDGELYYSDCGAHVVKVQSVTEISAAVYNVMVNI